MKEIDGREEEGKKRRRKHLESERAKNQALVVPQVDLHYIQAHRSRTHKWRPPVHPETIDATSGFAKEPAKTAMPMLYTRCDNTAETPTIER